MDASESLAAQIARVGDIVRDLSQRVDVPTSRARAFPGTNLIGFTLWHVARTVDWAINTMVRGTNEVAFDFGFEGPADARASQIGFGIALEEADAIAEATSPAQVAAYMELVVADAVGWLQTKPDMSEQPDVVAHQPSFPGYRTSSYLEEVRSYEEARATTVLMLAGPVVGHARGHLGEIDVLRQVLAAR